VLFNYGKPHQSPDGKPYASQIRTIRFDCKGERIADQGIAFYGGLNATGPLVTHMKRTSEQANAALEPTLPGTAGKMLLYAACEVQVRGKPSGQ
jgi:hypothetical protein